MNKNSNVMKVKTPVSSQKTTPKNVSFSEFSRYL